MGAGDDLLKVVTSAGRTPNVLLKRLVARPGTGNVLRSIEKPARFPGRPGHQHEGGSGDLRHVLQGDR